MAKKEDTKIRPFLSAETAFLGFIEDFNEFRANSPGRVFLRNGPRDPESELLPREVLGLAILANVAMFQSGDQWTPGYLVDVNGNPLRGDVAHDGLILCTSGPRKGAMMRFEQTMATSVAHNATPHDIEAAVLKEVGRKSDRPSEYIDGMALIVMVDYTGELGDLRKLAADLASSPYEVIFLIANTSGKLKDFVCVVLKSPGDTLGPLSVKFDRPDGKADVSRKYE